VGSKTKLTEKLPCHQNLRKLVITPKQTVVYLLMNKLWSTLGCSYVSNTHVVKVRSYFRIQKVRYSKSYSCAGHEGI